MNQHYDARFDRVIDHFDVKYNNYIKIATINHAFSVEFVQTTSEIYVIADEGTNT